MTGQSDNDMPPPSSQPGSNNLPPTTPPPGGLRRAIQKINPVISQTISRLKQLGQNKPLSSNQPWPSVQSPTVSPPPSQSPQIENPPPTGSPPPPSQPGVLLSQMHSPPPLPPPGAGTPGVFQRVVKKIDPVIAKTKIDLEACGMVMSQALASKEEKVKELRTTGTTHEPVKIVEGYKKAVPCDAAWESMSGTDQFRLCSKCRLNVYDFTNMNDEEAKALVFKREAISPEYFFQRKDGRFLIRDCPVAVNRARTLVACIIGGGLLTAGLFYWAITQPKPVEPVKSEFPQTPASTPGTSYSSNQSVTPGSSPSSTSAAPGKYTFTYTQNGQSSNPPAVPAPQLTPTTPEPQAGFKLPEAAPQLPPPPEDTSSQSSDTDALRGL